MTTRMDSTMSQQNIDEYAIYVVNAKKSYGSKKILEDFCMKVPRGCIYGLLGPSGCGKSTLLSCVVGRKVLNSGDIFVLGGRPGTSKSGVPGPRVGYMPQELALVSEFTAKDTIYYFGRVLLMSDEMIEERYRMLKQFLSLPPDNRQLKNCSGGQQRRVSLAVALVHSPDLLILDEPTVGLDPELRATIWNYLLKISEELQTAVIITTHYVEEARQAHIIGLMREGKLLAEQSPDRLLQQYNTDKLEEVFLILSKKQEEGRLDSLVNEQSNAMSTNPADLLLDVKRTKKYPRRKNAGCFHTHMKSLLSKNFKQLRRNPNELLMVFIFPILQLSCFLSGVGSDPRNLPLAVINEESPNQCTDNGAAEHYLENSCKFSNISCRFLQELENPMVEIMAYSNLETALNDSRRGTVCGVLFIPANFSDAFSNRINNATRISDDDLAFGEIKVWLDMSNRQIGSSLKARLYKIFENFQVSILTDCGFSERLAKVPLRFNFEYGLDSDSYLNFMVPGVIITLTFFLGAILTCTIIVEDRTAGGWDRSIIAGVSTFEIFLAHLIVQVCLIVIQAGEVILITFYIYRIEYIGKLWITFILIFVQSLSGMCFGFVVSIMSNSHSTANLLITGTFNIMIFVSGLIWPVEGQASILKYISLWLPFARPINSLRQVLKKDYDFDDYQVYIGMGVTLFWSLVLILICIVAMKIRR